MRKDELGYSVINDLIQIRNYVSNITESMYMFKKDKMKELNAIKFLLDEKIINELCSDEFKEFINFDKAESVMKEVRENSQVVKPK